MGPLVTVITSDEQRVMVELDVLMHSNVLKSMVEVNAPSNEPFHLHHVSSTALTKIVEFYQAYNQNPEKAERVIIDWGLSLDCTTIHEVMRAVDYLEMEKLADDLERQPPTYGQIFPVNKNHGEK